TRESIDEALVQFTRALQLDPNFASAHAMAAWCHFWRKVNGWMTDPPREIAEGARLARRAVELGGDDAVALTRGGHALAHLADEVDGGIALIDRALVLNPNLASAWFLGGFLRAWNGDSDGAIEHFARAMRLSPLDPETYRMQAGMAVAHLFAGRFDDASSWAEKSVRQMPSFLMVAAVLAASHALAGRMDEAKRAISRVQQLDPTLRVATLAEWLPIRRPENLATLADGLRRAGLPDGSPRRAACGRASRRGSANCWTPRAPRCPSDSELHPAPPTISPALSTSMYSLTWSNLKVWMVWRIPFETEDRAKFTR